ncbi:UNVERIFIED_ORG: hypothetical protein LHK14_01185 [Roseateles sp. XES5]|nr:hypothetical protein [Roseateles sp. XES5]
MLAEIISDADGNLMEAIGQVNTIRFIIKALEHKTNESGPAAERSGRKVLQPRYGRVARSIVKKEGWVGPMAGRVGLKADSIGAGLLYDSMSMRQGGHCRMANRMTRVVG